VTQAQAELDRVERQNEIKLADKTADLSGKQRRLNRREETIAKLKSQIEAATVKAPAAGLVVYGNTIEESRRGWSQNDGMQIGQVVFPNTLLFALPDTSRLTAEVRVHESLAGKIRPGQTAKIKVDAVVDRTFTGRVTKIGVLAEKGGWRDPNLREYTVSIEMDADNSGEQLKPSMRCEAEIQLGKVDQAIAVPVAAVFNDGPVQYVLLPKGKQYRRVPVKVGRTSDMMAEVVAGLETGQSVLVRNPKPGEVLLLPWNQGELQVVGLSLDEEGRPVRAAAGEQPQIAPASFSTGG
jgi:multidrug efflux pump subunit AcrA (membrane-fusion protein)